MVEDNIEFINWLKSMYFFVWFEISYGDKIWLHHLETGNNLVTQRDIVMREEEKQPSLDNTDQLKMDKNRQR